jgi:hypothetical protein
MTMADITALRLRMRANGFSPIPVMGKVPAMEKWQEKFSCTNDEIRLWPKLWHFAHNTGTLAKFTPGLDIDIKVPEAADAIEALAREFFEEHGDICVRFGEPPKRLVPLRTDEPFKKLRREFIPPNGLTPGEKPPAIEVLGDGQHYVVDGQHPVTHKPYRWHGSELADIKRDELPYVRREDAERLLEAATKLLVEEFGFTLVDESIKAGNGGDPHEIGEEPQAEVARIAAALAVIPNNEDWDGWNAIGMATWRATGGSAEGLAAFDAFSKRSPKYDAGTTAKKWAAYFKSPPKHIGAGTIFYLADQADSGWRRAWQRSQNGVPTHVWHSAHLDFPCTPTGERHHDKAGRVYARVTTPDGSSNFVPEDELEPVAQPASQPQPPPQTPPPQTSPPQTPPPQASTATQTTTPKPRRFAGKLLENVTMATAANYLIKGILPRTGLGVVWGPPKCGKSFWTFDLVMHIARGQKYRGHKVQQATVVYLALEGQGGFPYRIEAYRQRYLGGERGRGLPFHLIDEAINLITDAQALISALRQQNVLPSIIVIDTLNRAMVGDENSSEDMAKFIKAAATLQTAFNCFVLLIHHCGIAGTRPRGHTSLAGADDVQIAIERDKAGLVIATIEHAKDGKDGTRFASTLEQVTLGKDADGDPITSCVITDAGTSAAGPKLPKTQQIAYDALKKVLADKQDSIVVKADSDLAKKGIPIGTRVCRSEIWRARFYDTYPADKLDTKKKALLRATLDLMSTGLIVLLGEYVWTRTRDI